MFLYFSSSPCRPKQFHRYDDFYIQCTYRIMFRFFSVVTTCYFVKSNRVFPLHTYIVFQNVHNNYYFIAFLFYFTMMLNCRLKIVFKHLNAAIDVRCVYSKHRHLLSVDDFFKLFDYHWFTGLLLMDFVAPVNVIMYIVYRRNHFANNRHLILLSSNRTR